MQLSLDINFPASFFKRVDRLHFQSHSSNVDVEEKFFLHICGKNVWIESYAQRVIDTQDTLKEIDDKGSFEADDEIGVVFQSIKETIDELNEITQEEL